MSCLQTQKAQVGNKERASERNTDRFVNTFYVIPARCSEGALVESENVVAHALQTNSGEGEGANGGLKEGFAGRDNIGRKALSFDFDFPQIGLGHWRGLGASGEGEGASGEGEEHLTNLSHALPYMDSGLA